ncbi:MAG: YggT family protein [Ruoffia tabacinasalis]|uniref:YggT family protein n=1 Tax=Ruoffia tabacinasalis TaxID=87458 RepID=A0ABS0LJP2_9LACT|nr:YggT family protein [Ruoffia tabacinasalis]MBG9978473.1 YggT family protein [Ruoffia tabacinasalis]HBY90625.1 YggT family protein [Aerococcaceae bacterium]HJG48062.1 YggT family protein [Ruoffia tabacinasalis]
MGLLSLVSNLFQAYTLVLVVYALLSWLPGARESALGQFIVKLARPYLDIFDRFIPPLGGISFNVIIAIFVLRFIRDGLIWILAAILF